MTKPEGLNIFTAEYQYPGYPTLYNVYIRGDIFIGQLTRDSLHIRSGDFTLTISELEYLTDFMEKLKAQPSQPWP